AGHLREAAGERAGEGELAGVDPDAVGQGRGEDRLGGQLCARDVDVRGAGVLAVLLRAQAAGRGPEGVSHPGGRPRPPGPVSCWDSPGLDVDRYAGPAAP